MKESSVKTRLLAGRIKGYFDLLRPFTLIAPFFVSMAIMFASFIYNNNELNESFDSWETFEKIVYASLTLAFINAASNALNQSTDFEADKISKPYRPIPQGIVKPEEAQSIAYLLYFFALLRSITINAWFGAFVFFIMLISVTYSLPPRIKKYLFLNQIWIAIPRGLIGILAAWSVFGNPLQNEPLIIGLIAMVFFIGGMTTKDIVDSEADKKTGVHTLINTFGIKKAAYLSLPFLIIPFATIIFFVHYHIIKSYLLPLTLIIIPAFFVFYYMLKQQESKTLENVKAWSLMYVTYLLYAIGFILLIIFGELGLLDFIAPV